MKKFFAVIASFVFLITLSACSLKVEEGTEPSTFYQGISFIYGDKVIPQEYYSRNDSQIFFSVDFIKENLNNDVKYDSESKTLILEKDGRVKTLALQANEGYVNGKKVGIRDAMYESNGHIYVPTEFFIYDYPVDLRFIESKALILLDNLSDVFAIATADRDVLLHQSDDLSSGVVASAEAGTELYVLNEMKDAYRVRQTDGFIGYVDKSAVTLADGVTDFITKREVNIEKPLFDKKINLVWEYTQVKLSAENVKNMPGVNVVAPTVFSITDGNGTIVDRADEQYTRAYNQRGVDVWATLDNSHNPDITTVFINDAQTRNKIQTELISLLKKYGMQGLNIDFENVYGKDKDALTAFVSELYPMMKEAGLILSIDVTPISDSDTWSLCYDRKALAENVDFVCIMAYDQHWATSPVAGSVAQYIWVERTLNSMFRMIPKHKMVLGIPYYTRIWIEENGALRSESVGINKATDFVNKNNISLIWDVESGQFFGETTNGNTRYSLWLENEDSLARKVSLVHKYNLAGVAGWQQIFGNENAWMRISNELN